MATAPLTEDEREQLGIDPDGGPDYDEYAAEVIDRCMTRDVDLDDPEAVEEVAREVAEELVLHAPTLISKAHERADAFEKAGTLGGAA